MKEHICSLDRRAEMIAELRAENERLQAESKRMRQALDNFLSQADDDFCRVPVELAVRLLRTSAFETV